MARKDLQVCCEALSEIGNAYKNALRALEVVTNIKSDLLRDRTRNAKRSPAGVGPVDTGDSAGKRARVSIDTSVPRDVQGGSWNRILDIEAQDIDGFETFESSMDTYDPDALMDETLFAEPWLWTPSTNPISHCHSN
ncbi:hypothetical protein BDV59DRAFT_198102 [Aspergillus ambiguus]|uniref:uncharacterized protein n=1 Tax=Aspergillus ambiguus TaxID=176160 RepID=UPI003CCD2DBF